MKSGRRKGPRQGKWLGPPGVELKSNGLRGKSFLEYGGYRYCTVGEMQTAEMLDRQGIPFVPDCRTLMANDNRRSRFSWVEYVPDFLFVLDDGVVPCLWYGDEDSPILIHGLECKARLEKKSVKKPLPSWRLFKKQRLLWEQHGYLVIIISDAEVDAWHKGDGLPIRRIPLNIRRCKT